MRSVNKNSVADTNNFGTTFDQKSYVEIFKRDKIFLNLLR